MHELLTGEKYNPPAVDEKETKKKTATITEITEEEEEEEEIDSIENPDKEAAQPQGDVKEQIYRMCKHVFPWCYMPF